MKKLNLKKMVVGAMVVGTMMFGIGVTTNTAEARSDYWIGTNNRTGAEEYLDTDSICRDSSYDGHNIYEGTLYGSDGTSVTYYVKEIKNNGYLTLYYNNGAGGWSGPTRAYGEPIGNYILDAVSMIWYRGRYQ